MNPRIVVIGSINMDLVCRTGRIPAPGETAPGEDLRTIPGGKGANQAVAAARLGGDAATVTMIGRVGDDAFGTTLLAGLKNNGVDVEHVAVTKNCASGCALITVAASGENSIVVSPGANGRVTPADVERAKGVIKGASAVVMQLEIPLETVEFAIRMCRKLRVRTILDPAPVPAKGLPKALYEVDILSPNQSEARALAGRKGEDQALGRVLLRRGPELVVLKRGEQGALVFHGRDICGVRPFKVKAVDTTAAGDAFTAGLAVGLGEGMSIGDAVGFANAAGAICCTRFGAQPALPTRGEVERMLLKQR
ncbi:MAG: ribokinase [Tepidisphaeraceae bacterium]|jgi:ribokinase